MNHSFFYFLDLILMKTNNYFSEYFIEEYATFFINLLSTIWDWMVNKGILFFSFCKIHGNFYEYRNHYYSKKQTKR